MVRAAAVVGIDKVRLTGGEPTLRADILDIVRRLAHVPGVNELVMTTNGLRLPELARGLAQAGLHRVNIHIDSLDGIRLSHLMRFNSLSKVWAGIEAAERAELQPIKINMVVARDYNAQDVVDMARLTLKHPWHIRFIELMPLGEMADFALNQYVSTGDTMERIQMELGPLVPINHGHLLGEAQLFKLADANGTLGFISPVSSPYCDKCSRLRVTADGYIRPCLLSDQELILREVLRAGGTQADLEALFRQAIEAKPVGRNLQQGIHPRNRVMGQIGG